MFKYFKDILEYFFSRNSSSEQCITDPSSKENQDVSSRLTIEQKCEDDFIPFMKSGIFVFSKNEKDNVTKMRINYEDTISRESDATLTFYNSQKQEIRKEIVNAKKLHEKKCELEPFFKEAEVTYPHLLSYKAPEVTFKETLKYQILDDSCALSYNKTYTLRSGK